MRGRPPRRPLAGAGRGAPQLPVVSAEVGGLAPGAPGGSHGARQRHRGVGLRIGVVQEVSRSQMGAHRRGEVQLDGNSCCDRYLS